jgi:hypothetical protein
MKKNLILAATILLATGTSGASAKDRIPPGNLAASYALLQQKLKGGAVAPAGVAVDLRHPNDSQLGWQYIDALYCGWQAKDGTQYFYATDGNTTYWDVTTDHMLAAAMAIPCMQGNRLYVHVYTKGFFDEN